MNEPKVYEYRFKKVIGGMCIYSPTQDSLQKMSEEYGSPRDYIMQRREVTPWEDYDERA